MLKRHVFYMSHDKYFFPPLSWDTKPLIHSYKLTLSDTGPLCQILHPHVALQSEGLLTPGLCFTLDYTMQHCTSALYFIVQYF